MIDLGEYTEPRIAGGGQLGCLPLMVGLRLA